MVGWLVSYNYLFIDILWTVNSVTLFTLGGTLYLKKGIETSLMMISWEVGEEERKRNSILYWYWDSEWNDTVLVGGRMETIGLLDDSLHLGLFIMRVATIYRSIQAPGKMKRLREMQDTAKVGQ